QSALLVAAEPQRHASVRAEFVDESVPSVRIAKRQQTLRQELDTHRRTVVLGQLLGEERRNPVTAEHPAHRRAGTGLGQQVVLVLPKHVRSPPWTLPTRDRFVY